jgi:ABC-2 type transport system permease protein
MMSSLVSSTWVQTQRLLVRWARDPQTLIGALLLPVGFLFALDLVFGQPVSMVSGRSALYGTVPVAILTGVAFGASAAGVGLMRERQEGLLARFWVLPIDRASGPLSRLAAEAIRILLSASVVTVAGLLLGLRFHRGIVFAAGWLLVPVAFGVAFAALVTTMALYVQNMWIVECTGLIVMLLVFFCTGFVPLDQYPSAIQPVVEHQPMSYAVEAMRALALGGPVLEPLLGTLLWSAGIAAACAAPLLIGYRRASMR